MSPTPAPARNAAPEITISGRLLIDPAQPPELGWIRVAAGRIQEVAFGDPPSSAAPPTLGGRDRIITPAFIDAHMHFPQIDSVGCDGLTLLDWLDRVIFPAEAWWGRGAALPAARVAVRRLMGEGTVGAAAYLTSHGEPCSEVLSWLSTRTPLRFHAGRVAMDRMAPDSLTMEDRERARLRPPPSPILPAIAGPGRGAVSANPRFAVSCSDELLAEVGWAVKSRPGIFVQTHLSESREECALVARQFPQAAHYTGVYEQFGLLGARTLLGHCIHLSDDEWALIARRGAIAVHCPAANIFLKAGLFDYDRARAHGARVALGTDIAAGSDVGMPRVARGFIETAKVRAMTAPGGAGSVYIPSPAEAWRKITLENASLLGWEDGGRIEVGAAADLLVLRTPDGWLDEHLVGRLIYNWSRDLIESRVFAGAVVDPATIA